MDLYIHCPTSSWCGAQTLGQLSYLLWYVIVWVAFELMHLYMLRYISDIYTGVKST
jgi:hypothetical protein